MYLSSNSKYPYGQPISGQIEVSARSYSGDTELWIAQEGIYISSSSIVSNGSSRDPSINDDEL